MLIQKHVYFFLWSYHCMSYCGILMFSFFSGCCTETCLILDGDSYNDVIIYILS